MRQKKRDEQRQNAHNERFRIVNCSRTTTTTAEDGGQSSSDTEAGAKEITILDIEKDSECRLGGGPVAADREREMAGGRPEADQSQNVVASGSSATDGYVYDLYVPDVGQPELEWSEQFLENMLRFVPMDEEIHLTFSYTYF